MTGNGLGKIEGASLLEMRRKALGAGCSVGKQKEFHPSGLQMPFICIFCFLPHSCSLFFVAIVLGFILFVVVFHLVPPLVTAILLLPQY
jgi:hypothetical protein